MTRATLKKRLAVLEVARVDSPEQIEARKQAFLESLTDEELQALEDFILNKRTPAGEAIVQRYYEHMGQQ